MRFGEQEDRQASRQHDSDDAEQRSRAAIGSPPAWPASSSVAVIAPGPAISGIASGKAAMLRTCSSTASSACFDSRSMRTPNTISEAIANSSKPPAMRKAGSVMPSLPRSQSPISAVPARIAAAMMLARSATCRARRRRQTVR